MKKNLEKILAFLFIIFVFNIYFLELSSDVYAALYKSKGDNIPLSEIKYTEGDDEFLYFPEGYRENLKALKKAHPKWTFMAVYTNLDFYQSIEHESYEKGVNQYISTVPSNYSAVWKKDGVNYNVNGDSRWAIASKSAVGYCLDPRNWLSESYIFQFEVLNWAKLSKQDIEIAMKYLLPNMYNSKTYVDTNGNTVNMEKSYLDIIYEAGEENDLNPISIISKIKQEIGDFGADGSKNSSASGTVNGYVGYYNFFNVNATDGANAIVNGLSYAKSQGWDTPEKSIKAGAKTLYNDYIKYGQNTLYNQKFDVTNIYGNAIYLYAFQYMTNILDQVTQAQNVFTSYTKMGIIDSDFIFYIPVFENMPKDASGLTDDVNITYTENNDKVKVINCENSELLVRNFVSKDSSVIETVKNGEVISRLAVYSNGWSKVKLPSGLVGYVNNDYLEVYKEELNVEDKKEEIKEEVKEDEIQKEIVNVTGITLDKKEYELIVGEELSYKLTITPENATDKTYKITSKDSSIAEIKDTKVIGKKEGKTTLTFVTNDGSKTYEVEVNVKEPEVKYEINTKTLNVDKDKIKLSHDIKYKDVLSTIKLYGNTKIIAKDINGKELTNDSLMGTGTVLKIYDSENKELASYTIVVKGDVDGDGKISAADYVKIKNHIMGTASLNDIQKLGADANLDSNVSAADYVTIKNHIMGISLIN